MTLRDSGVNFVAADLLRRLIIDLERVAEILLAAVYVAHVD